MLVACFCSIALALPASSPNVSISARGALLEQPPKQLSVEQLRHLAQSLTVKVLSADVLGSGILIQKQGEVYTVLTNAHVLRAAAPPYRIQTPDGHIYPVVELRVTSLQGNDLGLLQFRTDTVYPVASLGASSTLALGDEVFASGFPFAATPPSPPSIGGGETGAQGFVFTTGKVSLVLGKALEGGYQIGYTNDIKKGMSGGPLLNRRGEVVGVNGMHASPLWDAPDLYQDGSSPSPALQEQIIRFSWAVPIEKVVQRDPSSIGG